MTSETVEKIDSGHFKIIITNQEVVDKAHLEAQVLTWENKIAELKQEIASCQTKIDFYKSLLS